MNHAWVNLLHVSLLATYLFRRRFIVLLNSCHRSFIDVWTVFFWINMSMWVATSALNCPMSALFQLYIFYWTSFRSCGWHCILLRMVLLWSPKPSVDLHRFGGDGWFVNKRSRVLLARVGNVINSSRKQLSITSINLSFVSLEYWWLITDLVSQLISDKLKSPPI